MSFGLRGTGFDAVAAIGRVDAALLDGAARLVGRWPTADRAMALAARHLAAVEVALLLGSWFGGPPGPRRVRRGMALRTIEALALTVSLVELSRRAFARPRPFMARTDGTAPVPHAASGSFPSKHAACAAAMATVALPTAPLTARSMAVLGALLSVSRVYVGLHYPSDVLAGWLVGVAVGRLVSRGGRYT